HPVAGGDDHQSLDVDGLGDIDGDGRSDLVVSRSAGVVLLYSGTGKLLMEVKGLAGLPSQGWPFGIAVANAGDIDGDGRNDVVIGDRWDDTNGEDAGRALVISSKPLPWTDLGHGLPGAAGTPQLLGSGSLQAGTSGFIHLLHVPANAPAILFVGLSAANLPFKGGLLVPSPDLALSFTASATGSVLLPWSIWPAGVPAYT